MARVDWHTTFDSDLKKDVAKTAIDLVTSPNMVLEIAYLYFKNNFNLEEANRLIKERKTTLRKQSGKV